MRGLLVAAAIFGLAAPCGAAEVLLPLSDAATYFSPALGKQVLVLREVTERPEAIDAGMARLVGTDPARIIGAVIDALDHSRAWRSSPYGDGKAGQRIANALQGLPVTPFTALVEAA